LIFDTAGSHSANTFRRMLTSDGRYVAVAFSPSAVLSSPVGGILTNRKVITYVAQPSTDDLATLRKMIESEKIKPAVDRVFELDRIHEAFEYWRSGKAKGKVGIHISD
jgi:D-arabinose 1-dehydrogenase-like Zn-dependent alcohol dehydrogenase